MKTYAVSYKCRNCYHAAVVWLPYQAEAPEYFDCPNCGRSELNKVERLGSMIGAWHYDADGETLVRQT